MDDDKVRTLLYKALEALGQQDKGTLNACLNDALKEVDVSYCRGCGCAIDGNGDGYSYCDWCA